MGRGHAQVLRLSELRFGALHSFDTGTRRRIAPPSRIHDLDMREHSHGWGAMPRRVGVDENGWCSVEGVFLGEVPGSFVLTS